MSNNLRINENIKNLSMLLIDVHGTNLGVVSRTEALKIAEETDLDLVAVSSENEKSPCVCKILDYNKMKYQQSKKKKNSKSSISMKEIHVNFGISDHDLEIKHKHVMKFLKKNHKVRYILQVRGRQRRLKEDILKRCNELLESFKEHAIWVVPTISEDNRATRVVVILTPVHCTT